MKTISTLSLIFAFAFCCGLFLYTNRKSEIRHTGEVNQSLFRTIKSKMPPNGSLWIRSRGGSVDYGLRIAELMLDNRISVVVFGECISACAEFIIPAATDIAFIRSPIIAYHWGPMMDRELYLRNFENLDHCDFQIAEGQITIFEQQSLNLSFWKEVEDRLELIAVDFKKVDSDCPWKRRFFRNEFWLPTSEQLRGLLGIEFTGTVCADDLDFCKSRIDHRWDKGTRIVIGDEVYTSQG